MESAPTPQSTQRRALGSRSAALRGAHMNVADVRVDGATDRSRERTDGQGVLRLLSVGGTHLDVAAVGAFTADRCGSIGDRLARLISGTPQVLRIDCRAVTALDPEVAQLFTDAATTLANRGGALALVDMPAPLRAMV